MNIPFTSHTLRYCQDQWNLLPAEQRITLSQYELAQMTDIDEPDIWLQFLREPRVSEKIREELQVYKESQQRKLIARATTHDKSIGTAQMINALGKSMEDNAGKSGDVIIYSYVPMNLREANAPNATAETTDIFETGE